MRELSRVLGTVLCLTVWLFSAPLWAQSGGPAGASSGGAAATPTKPPPLILDARLLHGARSPTVDGWFAVSVRVTNPGTAQIEGRLELRTTSYTRDEPTRTQAPFSVPGKGEIVVELPSHGFKRTIPNLSVVALDPQGTQLVELDLGDPIGRQPLLLDLTIPSRIVTGVRGEALSVRYKPPAEGGSDAPVLGHATPERSLGELVLPRRPSGYASVTVVLTRSSDLATLERARLQALVDWVLGGGALAVVVDRPEDLRLGTLPRMAGATLRRASVPEHLRETRSFEVPAPSTMSHRSRPSATLMRPATPTKEVADGLQAYAGGNLRQSPWGVSASYGLGELHLLAFDATKTPDVDDPWVKLQVLDLVRHAWDRQAHVAFRNAGRALDSTPDEIRRELDPNEGSRWSVIIAAVLLLVYALVAGPVNFYRASRAGKPLRALLHLPIYALGTTLALLLLGALSRGVSGRARHLTLIEAGAGMGRGYVTRYRGFYASNADQLLVATFDHGNVIELAGESIDDPRTLVVERDRMHLKNLQAKPWQTLVIREDGFTNLGGGVSLTRAAAGEVAITNRLGRDLVAVIAKVPGKPAVFFERIEDGKSVNASTGDKLSPRIGNSHSTAGRSRLARLEQLRFSEPANRVSRGSSSAWNALSRAAPGTDWWPNDVPTLIGQLDGGEGRSEDSGLELDQDRTLVRVIGYGGVK